MTGTFEMANSPGKWASPRRGKWLAGPLAMLAALLLGRAEAAEPTTLPATDERAHAELLVRQLDDPSADIRHNAGLQMNSLGAEA